MKQFRTKIIVTSFVLIAILSIFSIFVYKEIAIAEDSYDSDIKINIEHNKLVKSDISSTFNNKPNIELNSPTENEIFVAMQRESTEQKIDYLYNYLSKKNSSVFSREIVSAIINISDQYGADYRIIVAIMGKESGYCNANYKLYNCFGYLNGVQYNSFEDAFNQLTPKIARIVARNGWDIAGIAREYRPVDQVGWTNRVYKMASEL